MTRLTLVRNPAAPDWIVVYELARKHGLGHIAALKAAADGEVRCWCGKRGEVCIGGAQRHVGCPTFIAAGEANGHTETQP